ncbi:Hypothetical predicted protein [Mytilus galloprovincialis]|uniref:Uncharacterized protein n=1 Tax=Mytilus galloprovincialis TaxID=29158 RepID=A0A8B6EWJ5_MYTGA|nr:Hypothetical predicted protein [Mytilus galloprovincialis]
MGIAHNKGILYFCAYGRGVLKVKLLDFTVSDFYCPRYYVNFGCGVTLSKSNLCVCDQETDEILLFDLSANILWKFVDKNLLLTPGNVTSDANGNIYVLGLASYNVVFISADGKHSRQLLCREDGIENVVGTHYGKDRKVLKVVNIFGNVIIYNCP